MKIKKYKIGLVFVVFSIVLISSFLFLEILFVSKNTEKIMLESALVKAEERSALLQDFFEHASRQLHALNDSKAFKNYLQTGRYEPAADLFKTLVDSHEDYMQLRYIDRNGHERLRVDRSPKGLVKIIEEKRLQDKSKRSYFTDSKEKLPNKTWFLTLDFNVEHTNAKTPSNLKLRAVLPLEKEGKFNGILIANYSMKDFLDRLFTTSLYDMILINNKGKILKHYEAEKSGGRYQGRDYTIYDEFGPDAEAIFSKDVFIGEHFVSRKPDIEIQNDLILVLGLKQAYIDALFDQEVKEYIIIAIIVFILSLVANNLITDIIKNINRDLSRTKTVNSQLNELNTLLNDAQSIAKIGFWEFNVNDRVIYWSDEIYRIFGLKDTNIKPTYEMFLSYIHPDDREALHTEYQSSVNEKRPYYTRHRVISESGELKYVQERAQHYYDSVGRHIKSVGSIYDRTEETLSQNRINHYLKLIDENIISSSTDLQGTITDVSQAFCKISEYAKEELIGQNHRLLRCPETDAQVFKEMWAALSSDQIWQGELKNRKKGGGFYWSDITIYPEFDDSGKKRGYTAIRHDITDQKILEKLAITDAMTRLYNRRHFNDVFPKILNSAKRKNEILSFMIIDVDFFKQYNDTYGHQAGDEALIAVARVIENTLHRADDYAFRLGGEEFGVIFRPVNQEKGLELAQMIKDAVEALGIEHKKSSTSRYITVSIGLVTRHADAIMDNGALYKEADDLLYMAKKNGRNQIAHN